MTGTRSIRCPSGSDKISQTGGRSRQTTKSAIMLPEPKLDKCPFQTFVRYSCTDSCDTTSFCSHSISTSRIVTPRWSTERRRLAALSSCPAAAKAISSTAISWQYSLATARSRARALSWVARWRNLLDNLAAASTGAGDVNTKSHNDRLSLDLAATIRSIMNWQTRTGTRI